MAFSLAWLRPCHPRAGDQCADRQARNGRRSAQDRSNAGGADMDLKLAEATWSFALRFVAAY